MCRLFGFRSNVESRAHRSLIVAENAMANQASYHSDGWGIGYFIDDDPYLFRTSKGAAHDDSFRRFSEGLRSNTLLVHIRKATVGSIDPINSHPFRYGSWIFAHNGTIFGFEKVKARMQAEILPVYQRVLFGNTDSETIFYFILSAMVKRGCAPDGKCSTAMEAMIEAQEEAINQIF
jgi:glutamine amidotransferase